MTRKVVPPGLTNDHYASNPIAFDAVALMQHRIQSMGGGVAHAATGAPRAWRSGLGFGGAHAAPRRARCAAERRARLKSPVGPERPWHQRRRPQPAAAPLAPKHSDGSDSDSDCDSPAQVQQLTLAQRLGLVEMPEMPLTADEWDAAAAASKQRNYTAEPCAICCAPFRDERQVILSCTHVFHRDCIKSWEVFSQSQQGAKTCPCCRREAYQKRTFVEGGEIYRTSCAVRIQAQVRGLLARREVERLWIMVNPGKRRAYCERRLGHLTDRLTANLSGHGDGVDDFLASLDKSLAASRAVFAAAHVDWAYTERLARGMAGADHVCPICITSTCEHANATDSRDLTLLPCAHVFHARCLGTFEQFAAAGAETQSRLCPSCREPYAARRDFAWTGDAAGCGSVDRAVGYIAKDDPLKEEKTRLEPRPDQSTSTAASRKPCALRLARGGRRTQHMTSASTSRAASVTALSSGLEDSVLHGRRRGRQRKSGLKETEQFRTTM